MKKSFEQSIKRLEEVVAALESGKLSLEDSLKLYEEGTQLVAACSEFLDSAEQKISILTGADKGKNPSE